MKARLQTSMGQNLVMTPQLRQAIRLLQMSTTELEIELVEAVETNPLLEWAENEASDEDGSTTASNDDAPADPAQGDINADGEDWDGGDGDEDWASARSGSFDDDEGGEREQAAEPDTLSDHLLLHDRRPGGRRCRQNRA